MLMRLGALFTGGKDSTYSAFLESKDNEIVCLINARSANPDSYMFHTVGEELLDLQSEALGIPLERFYTKGEKEKELLDLQNSIIRIKRKYALDGVVSGALESDYQFQRIGRILSNAGLKSFTPLWHIDVKSYLNEFISSGFKAVIISVSADGLDQSWLGREIDKATLAELDTLSKRFRFHLGFEGGEAETAVLDGPSFKKMIIIQKTETIHDGNKHYLKIISSKLESKL